MMATVSREIRLSFRPRGWPTLDNFALSRVELLQSVVEEVLMHNLLMSVDPYMRGRMNNEKSYIPPFQSGQPREGAAVGEVVESRASGLAPGDIVTSAPVGASISSLKLVRCAPSIRRRSPSTYLGVLGSTGLTALGWIESGPCEGG